MGRDTTFVQGKSEMQRQIIPFREIWNLRDVVHELGACDLIRDNFWQTITGYKLTWEQFRLTVADAH